VRQLLALLQHRVALARALLVAGLAVVVVVLRGGRGGGGAAGLLALLESLAALLAKGAGPDRLVARATAFFASPAAQLLL